MAIRTRRDKHRGAHARRMKGNRRVAPRHSNDVLRFAPNFSVYVLPPDTVCLYSEDRKFFLHGELYCALASAIAEDGKSVRALVRDLEQKFPSDKIDEAIKRLLDRRFAVSKPHSARDSAAAYWASLGLPPETAEKNLQNYPVRIQSFDVQGGKELAAALSELGVRITKRSAALTIALVGDYLDARLVELNRKNLSDRTPWMVVQPSGIFPLIGPLLRPGKGACWVCLAARMVRNREIKAMLDRKGACQIAASPLARQPVGQSGMALAAVEIAKAIATEFRTDLSDHILSLDLLGSTIVRHYVPARPQCPACGRKKLRDPSRAAAPLKLAAGGKLVMTSGGYRTVSSGATVARFRKHVSLLTGVVSRLERIDADLTPTPAPFNPSAQIEWSPVWSLRHERFKYLPSSLLYFFYRGGGYQHHADSNGCAAGNTLEEAIVQGFLELVERDAYAIWWYNRLQRPELDLGQFDDSYVRDLRNKLAETGRRVWVLDVTSDLGVPTFVAITHWMQNGRE